MDNKVFGILGVSLAGGILVYGMGSGQSSISNSEIIEDAAPIPVNAVPESAEASPVVKQEVVNVAPPETSSVIFAALEEERRKVDKLNRRVIELEVENKELKGDVEAVLGAGDQVSVMGARTQVRVESLEAENANLRRGLEDICRGVMDDPYFLTTSASVYCR